MDNERDALMRKRLYMDTADRARAFFLVFSDTLRDTRAAFDQFAALPFMRELPVEKFNGRLPEKRGRRRGQNRRLWK
jgi:hypothetical protein